MVISSYSLPLTVIEYQTAVIRGDLDAAAALLPNIESGHYNKIARFLEAQGQLAAALQLTQDLEHKFELGLQLEQLEVCHQVALTLDQDYKWKALADHALKKWNYPVAIECLKHAKDLDSLLLIYQCSGNRQGIEELVEMASGNGDLKLMFTCNLILGKMEACLDILLKENRFPEAAFFARSHLPNAINHVVNLWKEDLIKSDKSKVAEHLANVDSPECFPDLPYMFCGQLYRDSIAVQPARSLLIEVPNITNEQAIEAVKALIAQKQKSTVADVAKQELVPAVDNAVGKQERLGTSAAQVAVKRYDEAPNLATATLSAVREAHSKSPEKAATIPARVPSPEKAATITARVPSPEKVASMPARVPSPEKVASMPARVPSPKNAASMPARVPSPEKPHSMPARVPSPSKQNRAGNPLSAPSPAPFDESTLGFEEASQSGLSMEVNTAGSKDGASHSGHSMDFNNGEEASFFNDDFDSFGGEIEIDEDELNELLS